MVRETVSARPLLLPYCASTARYAGWLAARLRPGCGADRVPLAPKELTRTHIRGASAPVVLSVPVEGGNRTLRALRSPEQATAVADSIMLSEHGGWRHVHINALRTAYSSTPFFAHFSPALIETIESASTLGELLRGAHSAATAPFTPADINDLRALLESDCGLARQLALERCPLAETSLSFLDALFRLGREAIFTLLYPLI